jgi:hypothetical protein
MPERRRGLLGPREFALTMIGLGLFGLVLAIVQHLHHARTLKGAYAKLPLFSIGLVIAVAFALFGVAALIAAFLRQ